ncbi:MAG: polysaccharide biosynthesis protein [Deltaproteobacteria bacterium HGW-Deltaproteobacteria-6]|nr:MAG: polysaccharide biosynthesis protein [Deltaproteobacteria bacterium HGW-Deltaproteobacteria-6]
MNPQLKNPKFYLMIFSDILLFIVALCLSYLIRFEFSFDNVYTRQIYGLILWIVPLKLVVFLLGGLYRGMWRFTGVRDFWLLAKACLLSTMLIMLIILIAKGFQGYSRGVFIADGIITFMLTGGVRMAIRSFYAVLMSPNANVHPPAHTRMTKVLIIGAGQAGEKILREIIENYNLNYEVVGFIDDDAAKQGRTIHGIRVLGTLDHLSAIIEKEDIQQILIAIPSASGDKIRRIVESCQQSNTSYKILPGIGDLIDGRVSVKFLRDISYEDLLGRSPVQLDTEGIRSYLDGKIILITGCGGSIGSELCRQVVKYQPRNLILIDSSESSLFSIQMEMQNENYCRRCEAVLGQVQDEVLMNTVFEKYKPDVVFHAAAYKHVPMMEKNPWQAVYNNIIGSRVIMETAVRHHVDRFVLVSTDKAVRPTNVMGASKRVTELIMQCQKGNGTRFMAVRFGNVVGSSGSVIPFFRRQIEQGGPVTVTHPEVNRFFMTIPEASQMILQAGTMGEGGEIFILKMGTPVKIIDMARDLIRLSGKEPDVDIKIVFTGLREGEKLYEELITEGEDILPTGHKKVMVLRSDSLFSGAANPDDAKENLYREIDELVKMAERHDAKSIKAKLKEIVPEFAPQENDSVL